MSRLREFADTKIGSALILAGIMAVIGLVSGVAHLPANDARQDKRLDVVETETRTLRESGIRNEARYDHIKEKLDEIAAKLDRRERGVR